MDVPSIYDDQVCDIDPAYADEDDVPLLAPSAGSSENKPSKEKKHGMTLPSTNNEWLLPGLCVATACLAIFIIIRLAQGSSGSQDGSVTKFIHVSKAGGSLLCSLARANNGTTTFGENCALDTLDRGFLTGEKHRLQRKEPIYYSVSPGELWWCPTLLKSKNAFSQEEIATLEEMELLARGELTTNLVIAVRDPVKRFLAWLDRFTTYHSGFDELDQKIVSKFVTVVGNPKLHTEEQVRKALDGDKALRPFVEADGCYNYRAQFYNFHMRHLLGSKVMDAKTPPDSTTLKRAQERLDKFDVVLDLESMLWEFRGFESRLTPIERLYHHFLRLGWTCGWPKKHEEVPLLRSVTEEEEQDREEWLTPQARDVITDANKLDQQLIAYAHTIMDKQVEAIKAKNTKGQSNSCAKGDILEKPEEKKDFD